jgi:hypothetical protein
MNVDKRPLQERNTRFNRAICELSLAGHGFRLIDAEKAHHGVSRLCRVLDVSRAGDYAFQRRLPSHRLILDLALTERIRSSTNATTAPTAHPGSTPTCATWTAACGWGASGSHGCCAQPDCKAATDAAGLLCR